jgi:glucose-6-phosphate isomerase
MAVRAKAALKPPVIKPLSRRKAWTALKKHYKTAQALHLKKLFDDNPRRAEEFTLEAVGIYLDY